MANAKSDSAKSGSWDAIFDHFDIHRHDFNAEPFVITARQIGVACQHFPRPGQKEARILCKQDNREDRPRVFQEKGLFLLPIKNGEYAIIKGEGYVDIPPVESPLMEYESGFPFELKSSLVGDSEMQHLDRAYALSLIRHVADDDSLVLTIRGRKYTPEFRFRANGFPLAARSVQTEVDSGYEGRDQLVLIEAKSGKARNTIIRQLYYPYRQWLEETGKKIVTLFFQRTRNGEYHIWHFGFRDTFDYDSIQLVKSARYRITLPT